MIGEPVAFRIAFPEEDLEDLRARLARTRWPDDPGPVGDWGQGTDQTFLRELVRHWLDDFDWRRQESDLNRLPQYKLRIGDDDLHFVHQQGYGLPILLLNGWPSSVWEFSRLIPLLNERGFAVVAPSLPGFTFSFTPGRRPTMVGSAEAIAELMTVLGYERFGVIGGDTGASVMSRLAFAHPGRLAGIFYTFISIGLGPEAAEGLGPEAERYARELEEWRRDETGYFAIQGTKPRTLAYGLTDSPSGLAAWVVEKMIGWSDRTGAAENPFTADDLLTNVTIFWLTGCIGSSFWPYWARMHGGWSIQEVLARRERLAPPAGYAVSPADYPRAPRALAERFLDLRHFSEMPAGGHFPAFEMPSALAAEVTAFFGRLR